jgi:hypothetical protein
MPAEAAVWGPVWVRHLLQLLLDSLWPGIHWLCCCCWCVQVGWWQLWCDL